MTTRREFVTAIHAVGTAFAVGGHRVLDNRVARAQGAAAPLVVHFDPKGSTSEGGSEPTGWSDPEDRWARRLARACAQPAIPSFFAMTW